MQFAEQLDVIVVGGGHAGCEAALAAARMGSRTLLLTQSIDTLGQMSCNPAIGGVGKGHLVKEIDALGGMMGRAADRAGIHFRMLNSSKGPAVRATRAQIDRALYRVEVRRMLESEPRLRIFQQPVVDLLLVGDDTGAVCGVQTEMGLAFRASAVVLTVGTFLGGKIHVGLTSYDGGRAGDRPANALAAKLRSMPFNVGRLKTGTPPRIDGATIDWGRLEVQPADEPAPVFSYLASTREHPRQVACHITHTNPHTHQVIRRGLDRSPMYSGVIDAAGPRYCPSVEDKVVRFAAKTSHQIFVEPEGLATREIYPNGISTSLPFDIQYEMVRTIAGFERAEITRPGYAIEYDFFDPRGLHPWLETRFVPGLFFAGQINGTTGYEEAAAQGLVAGTNAALRCSNREPWWPRRDEAYIGVLIDDLVTRGTDEPYRMFTSRAEYRLSLREDNADLRLTEVGRELGLVGERRWRAYVSKRDAIGAEQARLERHHLAPRTAAAEVARVLGQPLVREQSLMALLRRPEVSYDALMSLPSVGPGAADPAVRAQVEIQAKYSGYIGRQAVEIERARGRESLRLPADLAYESVPGLSAEAREKLRQHLPATLGQASRIPGVTPAAISLLLVHLRRQREAGGPAPGPAVASGVEG